MASSLKDQVLAEVKEMEISLGTLVSLLDETGSDEEVFNLLLGLSGPADKVNRHWHNLRHSIPTQWQKDQTGDSPSPEDYRDGAEVHA